MGKVRLSCRNTLPSDLLNRAVISDHFSMLCFVRADLSQPHSHHPSQLDVSHHAAQLRGRQCEDRLVRRVQHDAPSALYRCKISSAPIHLSHCLGLSDCVPAIVYKIYDLEAFVQPTLIEIGTGSVKACVQTTLSNG